MSFSFDASLDDNISLVRFHIGDTDSDGYFLEDETIEYWVNAGDVETAVIACIKFILSQFSRPNFSLDWLSVSGMADAKKGYEDLLKRKEREFGIVSITAASVITQPYRADSRQDTDDDNYPTYRSEFEE